MNTLPQKQRIESIDLLRGIVMVIMALDHVRDYVHFGSILGRNPLDLETTSFWFFMTRWITHYCAPTFVFLAGTSIFLMSRKKEKKELSFFLFTRGLFLVFIELTVVTLGWTMDLQFRFLVFQVIGAIGTSMILMSGLIFLPNQILLILGLVLVGFHNHFDSYNFLADDPKWGFLASIAHVFHIFELTPNLTFGVIYPVLPWLGIMMCGYGLGNLYRSEFSAERRKKFLIGLGLGAISLFILLRFPNVYGDSKLWSPQSSALFNVLSFVNTSKYPPSLLYALMTIGPGLLFLAFSEKISNSFTRIFLVFGRVPMFYYLLHIYLIRLVSWLLLVLGGYQNAKPSDATPFGLPEGFGLSLAGTYAMWILVVFILYFPCRWYMNYKARNTHWWLSYL